MSKTSNTSKTYTYEEPYYFIEVTLTTIVAELAIVYCAYQLIRGETSIPAVYTMFLIAAVYQVWNAFVSAAYPHHVIVDGESITFCYRKRQDRYPIKSIKALALRANVRNGRIFLRINNPTPFAGRYWIATKVFTDGEELFFYIDDLDNKLNPQALKAKARTSNEKWLTHQEEIKAARAKEREERAARRKMGKKHKK